MIEIISVGIFILLTATALIHFFWALGGDWPGHDETSLAKTVVGENDIKSMPPQILTTVVAILIFASGVWALLATDIFAIAIPQVFLKAGVYVLAAVFILRGAVGLLPLMARFAGEEPFATLNKRFYSPLILMIGAGYFVIGFFHF